MLSPSHPALPVPSPPTQVRLKGFEFLGVTTHDPLPMFFYVYEVADDFSSVTVLWSAAVDNERGMLTGIKPLSTYACGATASQDESQGC